MPEFLDEMSQMQKAFTQAINLVRGAYIFLVRACVPLNPPAVSRSGGASLLVTDS